MKVCRWIFVLTLVISVPLVTAQQLTMAEQPATSRAQKPPVNDTLNAFFMWVTDGASLTLKNTLSDTLPLALAPGATSINTGQGLMWQPSFLIGYKLSVQNDSLKTAYQNAKWYPYVKPLEVGYSWGLGAAAKNGIPVGTSPWVLSSWQRQSTFYVQAVVSGDNVRQMLNREKYEAYKSQSVARSQQGQPPERRNPTAADLQAELSKRDATIQQLSGTIQQLSDRINMLEVANKTIPLSGMSQGK
jgi:hypothetical protein